jgi:hypothetical protein
MDPKTDTVTIDETPRTVEELVAEYLRVREWCGVCCGVDVAKWGGLPVSQ